MTAPVARPADVPEAAWSTSQKFAFRFAFSYFVLYNFPFPLSVVPGLEAVLQPYTEMWHKIGAWVGKHVLHLAEPITIFENGSGDTTYNYVQVLCFVVIASGATLIWSALDRQRQNYTHLHLWLRVYLRYALGLIMVSYGAYKVIKSQFPNPSLMDLLEPYGKASPMGLLWTFMGYSLPYNIFAGGAEMMAGILVMVRRTTTVGALLAISVLANVVMLNFSYDVPVKLFSLHLMAMAVFLLLPDLDRLADLFLFNRSVEAAAVRPLFQRPRLNQVSGWLGVLFMIGTTAMALWQSREGWKTYGDGAPKPALYGIYEVTGFVRNHDTLPPMTTDTIRWRRFVVGSYGATVTMMSDSVRWYRIEVDTAKAVAAMTGWHDSTEHLAVAYQRPDSLHLAIATLLGADSVHATLVRRDEKDFLLLRRGFHWINETPFNR
jgi:hypothetical protein